MPPDNRMRATVGVRPPRLNYHKILVVVMIQGWLLGLLAHWRKSLRPGMLAHALQDVIGGMVAFLQG